MRALPSVGAAALAVTATVLFAPAAFAAPPGDNGTVKIHDAKTGAEDMRNEPHVCTFYLDAFKQDPQQQVSWHINDQPPTGDKDTVATSGTITLGADGHGRTDDISLPDGHYKLYWNFDGEHGRAKQKVFWVDCADETGSTTGSTGSTTGETTTGGTTGETTGGAATGGDTSGSAGTTGATGTTGAATGGSTSGTPSATPSTDTDSESGNLAETGTSVIGIAAIAAVLLAVGGAVVFRRRAGRQH